MRKKRKEYRAGQVLYKNWEVMSEPNYDALLVVSEESETGNIFVIELTDHNVMGKKRVYSRDFMRKYSVYEEPNV